MRRRRRGDGSLDGFHEISSISTASLHTGTLNQRSSYHSLTTDAHHTLHHTHVTKIELELETGFEGGLIGFEGFPLPCVAFSLRLHLTVY
jgi:hypothetical protein